MIFQQYMNELQKFQENMIEYLDKDDDYNDNYQNLSNYLNDIFNKKDFHEIIEPIKLIDKITNHHHRTPHFFDKIQQIFLNFSEQIKQTFSNHDIFKIFCHNKLIILILIKNSILELDDFIINEIKQTKDSNLIQFLFPEIKPYLSFQQFHQIKDNYEFPELDEFEKRRKNGENDLFICELIRNDSIIEFIKYINQTNFPINNKIGFSIYETNSFLNNKNPTLIEYAAFFGSIQIFKYLSLNDAVLSSSLWLYAIHGANPEIIYFLEENKITPTDFTYRECYKESIKCFNNDIANYILNSFIDIQSFQDDNYNYDCIFKYRSYLFFPNDFQNSSSAFFYLCKYNYIFLVDKVLKLNKVNIYEEIILTKKSFFFINEVLNLINVFNDVVLRI